MRGHATPLDYHRNLLDDAVRVTAYERALRAVVRPGDVVLDLGAGTCILAMFAARLGARVHAVESMPVAALGRDLVAANGLSDRITVHHADVVELAVAEPVDLVVGDFMGRFVLDDQMLDAVAAAAAWLKPGGRFCPGRIHLRLAPVASFALPQVDRWRRPLLGVDLGPGLARSLHTCYAAQLDEGALAGPAETLHTVHAAAPRGDIDRHLVLPITTPGELRGILGWFDADLTDDIVLSTRPGTQTHWGQYLFPLPPTAVAAGDALHVHLRLLDPDTWGWAGQILRGNREVMDFDLDSRGIAPAGQPPRLTRALDRPAVIAHNQAAVDALGNGQVPDAVASLEAAAAGLTPSDLDLAAPLFENLGLARLNAGDPAGAAECFHRALDGDLASREQALRFLVQVEATLGHGQRAGHLLRAYEAHFGRHPLSGDPA